MKYFLIVLPFLCSLVTVSFSQNRTASGTPRVVIGIVVENMRPDYVERYRNNLGNDGFKKLFEQGTSCPGFRMNQFIQNNASGTATLFTGVYPSVHGIIDNNWYDRSKSVERNCCADVNYTTTGADTKSGNVSPLQLRSTTLAEQLKLSTNGKAKVYSVAMNDAPAVFSSGFSGDAAFWFDQVSGRMITSSFYMKQLPDWVVKFNQQDLAQKFTTRNWVLLKSVPDYKESLADNDSLEAGYGPGLNVFPHNIGDLVKKAGDFSPLKTTPFANSLIKSFALDLMDHEPVGTDEFPDLITLFFSSMDEEQGAFGPASVEMEDLYLRLDQEIAEIINHAENKFGKENVLFFLTSNTSASYPVNYLKEKLRIPAGSFSPERAYSLLNAYLNITFGDLRWIDYFNGFQLYLNHKLIELNKVDLKDIRKKSADFLIQFEGIHLAVTADQIEQGMLPDSQCFGITQAYVPFRSGDVIYVLEEGWQPVLKSGKGNYTDQASLPLVFYGAGIQHRIITAPVDATDFVPTISEILKIPQPPRCHGKIIEGF